MITHSKQKKWEKEMKQWTHSVIEKKKEKNESKWKQEAD